MKRGFSLAEKLGLANIAQSNLVKDAWDKLSPLPGGKRLYSRILSQFVPYTGSMPFTIEELRPGHAKISLKDQRCVRNHLRCIHAIALANLAELTGSMALTYGLPRDARFIVKKLSIDFERKARGTIYAVCTTVVPTSNVRNTYDVTVELFNTAEEQVSTASLSILIGPHHS